MATYTTNYHLEKPAQSDLYNIDVFNGNADTIDTTLVSKSNLSNLATVESTNKASKAYAVGEYLVYNGLLHIVTTAIASGGTITPGTNVSQISVGYSLNNSMKGSEIVAANTDLNTIINIGVYNLNGNSNYSHAPISASMYGTLTVLRSGPNRSFITQIITATAGSRYFYRESLDKGSSWTTWFELVRMDTLTTLLEGKATVNLYQVPASKTTVFTVNNNTKAVLFLIGAQTATCCMIILNATSGGVLAYQTIGTATAYTITSTTNQLSVQNTTSVNPSCYALIFNGGIPSATST